MKCKLIRNTALPLAVVIGFVRTVSKFSPFRLRARRSQPAMFTESPPSLARCWKSDAVIKLDDRRPPRLHSSGGKGEGEGGNMKMKVSTWEPSGGLLGREGEHSSLHLRMSLRSQNSKAEFHADSFACLRSRNVGVTEAKSWGSKSNANSRDSGGRQSRFCETPARPHSPHMQFDSNCSGTGREQIEYSLKIMSPLRRVRATSTSANQGGERER